MTIEQLQAPCEPPAQHPMPCKSQCYETQTESRNICNSSYARVYVPPLR